MKKYKRVDLSTVKGFEKAERLQRAGWVIVEVGFDYVLMER